MIYFAKNVFVVFIISVFSSCYKETYRSRLIDRGPYISKIKLCGTSEKTWKVEQLTGTYSEYDRQIGTWVDHYTNDLTDTTLFLTFWNSNLYTVSDSLAKWFDVPKSAFWSTADENYIKGFLLDSNRLLDSNENPVKIEKYTAQSSNQDESLWLSYKYVHWTMGGDVTRYMMKLKPKR